MPEPDLYRRLADSGQLPELPPLEPMPGVIFDDPPGPHELTEAERKMLLEWRPSLEVVRDTAEHLRTLQAERDQAIEDAKRAYANALREALRSHTKHQVAEAAGVSYQAVYRAIKER